MRRRAVLFSMLAAACAGPEPAREVRVFEETATGGYRPQAADRAALSGRLVYYWSALRAGRYQEAYAVLTEDARGAMSMAQFRAAHPPLSGRRRIVRLHWVREGSDLYCVVDWSVQGLNAGQTEGQMVWTRDAAGGFSVLSVNTGQI